MCRSCEAPVRTLWPPVPDAPPWEERGSREWMTLVRCRACGRLWACVSHEPHASFPYAALWPHDASEWKRLHDFDSGASLHAWHQATIRDAEPTLSDVDREVIRAHRRRSFGRAPFPEDEPPEDFDLEELRARIRDGGS